MASPVCEAVQQWDNDWFCMGYLTQSAFGTFLDMSHRNDTHWTLRVIWHVLPCRKVISCWRTNKQKELNTDKWYRIGKQAPENLLNLWQTLIPSSEHNFTQALRRLRLKSKCVNFCMWRTRGTSPCGSWWVVPSFEEKLQIWLVETKTVSLLNNSGPKKSRRD